MNKSEIIEKTTDYVKATLKDETTGHDWFHIQRVRNSALLLAAKENADPFITEIAALLHDIADHKFHGGDHTVGPATARKWLLKNNVREDIVSHICEIIEGISFKGAGVETNMRTIEGKVVQDADRLDAIGAIGIARCFAYGGSKNHKIFDPGQKPQLHQSFEKYKTCKGSSIAHFYEKLLLLKDRMNTQTARRMAEERHLFMEIFLGKFFSEWDGK